MYIMSVILTLLVYSYGRTPEVVGYWENWNNVKWWDNNMPGNCAMGCAKPHAFLNMTASYSVINYGFTFLTEKPNAAQVNCPNASSCPAWDGLAIYAAKKVTQGSQVVTASTTVHGYTPGLISIGEVCRLAHMHPNGPKRCKIVLGGWSDWARVATVANAQKLGKFVANMVLLSFADGVDLDFEHLSEFSKQFTDEFAPFNALIKAISQEFDNVKKVWVQTATTRKKALAQFYDNLEESEKAKYAYYPTNVHYLTQVIANGAPELEISWTTRFNAFLDPKDPFNIYTSDSPHPKVPFLTDNEGMKIWPQSGQYLGSANIMAYDAGSDAGPLKLAFQQILKNFKSIGNVDASKVNMGYEPGKQAASAVWEGFEKDQETTTFVKENAYGGVMVWAINPSANISAHWCPLVAADGYSQLQPVYPYGTPPVYDKCDPNTGWWTPTSQK